MASESALLQYTIVLSLTTFFSLADKPFLEHDKMIRHVVLEPSHEIKRRSIDQPLRISLDFLDIHKLENPTIVKDILREAQEYFKNTLTVRKTTSKILLQRRCSDKLFFMKNANGTRPGKVRFCHEACNSSRIVCGPIEIPEHDLDQCRICDQNGQNCQNDTRPGYTAGEGHNDTDFILYVTAVADGNCNSITTLAYGSACQQESSLDRPVVGFINICPEKVTANELRTSYSEVLATIKHEIFHVLGFAPSLYAFYRNQNGDPLTPRSSYGLPATKYDRVLKHYKWSEEVIDYTLL